MNVHLPSISGRRFVAELEFVQCLSDPDYVHWLARDRYFEDDSFCSFLHYLDYWKRPEYVKYIQYPYCLSMLDLLKDPAVQKELIKPTYAAFIRNQLLLQWSNRRKYGSVGV